MILLEQTITQQPIFTNYLKSIKGIVPLVGLFIAFLYTVNGSIQSVLVFSSIPLIILFLQNYNLWVFILPIFFFLNTTASIFSLSELFVLLLFFSFTLTHKNLQRKDFDLPLITPFLLYLSVLILSVSKSINPLLSFYAINHYLFFLLLIWVLFITVKKNEVILRIIHIYLFALAINTVHVITQAVIEGGRVFGFAGIMYVDYVSLGIVLTVILFLFSKENLHRLSYAFLVVLFSIGSILTQTRNTWISTIVTLILVFGFVGVKQEYFKIDTKKIIKYLLFFLLIVAVGTLTATIFNPKSLNRVIDSQSNSQQLISDGGIVSNSLVSRLLIWHTAYNAFIANPILGIGAYSFPFTSQYYFTINKYLYKVYVEKLTPHETFFAVTVETGLLGLIVFLLLYISIIKYVFNSIQKYNKDSDKHIGLLLGAGIFYCHISMFTTDAWLWGNCIIIWGLLIGLLFAHNSNTQKI